MVVKLALKRKNENIQIWSRYSLFKNTGCSLPASSSAALMGPSNVESAGILSLIIYPHCLLSLRNWLVCDLLTLVRSDNHAIGNSWLFMFKPTGLLFGTMTQRIKVQSLSPLEKHIQGVSWICSMCILWRETLIRMFRTIAFINDQTHILLS